MIIAQIEAHKQLTEYIKENLTEKIKDIAVEMFSTICSGGKIILMGNGGSASDAQHIAAEFVGRFVKERIGLPAIALNTDTSILTAIGNDYGFENIFARQIDALARNGDIIFGISTSGNSENVIRGLKKGKEIGCKVFGLSGQSGGQLRDICDHCIVIPSYTTARIQEMHILIGHLICELIDHYWEVSGKTSI
jgi:D-sedoheptulose 7-phosphate isomerase